MSLDGLTIATQGLLSTPAEIALQGLLDIPPTSRGGGLWDWNWHETRRKRAEEERLRQAREELGIVPVRAKGPAAEPEEFEPPLDDALLPPRRKVLSLKPRTDRDDALVQSVQSAIVRLGEHHARAAETEQRLVVQRRQKRIVEAKRMADEQEQQRLALVEQERVRKANIERDNVDMLMIIAQLF